MIAFDTITLIIGVIVVGLAILASLINPFLRSLDFPLSDEEHSEEDLEKPTTKGVSILIPTHDNVHELERNLPSFLQQDYADYQVIVVCDKSDNDTIDLLKRLEADHSHLYHTFIPDSSRYMSRKKLQITVGVKAAKHEWIILTEPTCKATTDQWLKAMVNQCEEPNHLVLGYVALDEETGGYRRFENIRTAYYLLRRAQRSYGYRSHMTNIAFRRSDFLHENGYQGNLHLERGEYDFLVNKYGALGNTVVELDNTAWLLRDEPSNKSWHNAHLYLLASKKFLHRHTSMSILHFFDHLIPHLSLLCSIAALALGILTENWIMTGCAGFALLLLLILRMIIAHRAIRHFDTEINTLAMPFYEYSIIWRNLIRRIRYWHADKSDFTSHKL